MNLKTKNSESLEEEELTMNRFCDSKKIVKSISEISRKPKFILYFLIITFNWFSTTLVYSGLNYYNNFLFNDQNDNNIFLNWILITLIELPAQLVCYMMVSRWGRRPTISTTMILTGFFLISTSFDLILLADDHRWITTFKSQISYIRLGLILVAKFFITQSYNGVILQAPELFPSKLR
jgi:hypothetical protein